jgi:hypothetical protein
VKAQTRKSISVRGVTYRKLRGLAKATGDSMSEIVEEALAPHLVDVAEDHSPDPKRVNRIALIRAAAARRE